MKPKPYLLLFFLGIVLVFILGVRYGQNVEKTNKAINYLLSITPTKNPTPTVPIEYKTFENKFCGIKFLTPSILSLKDEATKSATFVGNGSDVLQFSCEKQSTMLDALNDKNVATGEVTFKNKKIPVKMTNNNEVYILKILNPINNQSILVDVTKSLYPLFENSVQFVP